MSELVTVAIPTLNAGPEFVRTLAAVRAQRLGGGCELELVVCDSGSDDGTVAMARSHGARVIEILRSEFSHGGTRNRMMSESTRNPRGPAHPGRRPGALGLGGPSAGRILGNGRRRARVRALPTTPRRKCERHARTV